MDLYCTSPWIPPEWIQAHGLTPRGLWCATLGLRRLPLCQGVCPFAESCVRFAQLHPEAGFILDSGCDQLRRSFDLLLSQGQERLLLFNLPSTWQSPAARRLYRAELERLGLWMRGQGGQPPDAIGLRGAIEHLGRTRRQLLECAAQCSAREYAEAVAQFYWDGTLNLPKASAQPSGAGTRLALVGGPLPASQWRLLDMLEADGARIVLNATSTGERSLAAFSDVDPEWSDPLDALTDSYCQRGLDVFQRPNVRLYDWMREQIVARQVQGIVLWNYVGCDLWRAEANSLRDRLGLPVCQLEAENLEEVPPSQASRIQAFLELLG